MIAIASDHGAYALKEHIRIDFIMLVLYNIHDIQKQNRGKQKWQRFLSARANMYRAQAK